MEVKEAMLKYGTCFKVEGGTPDYFIKRCDEQIANYKKWLKNLEELKNEKLAEKANEQKNELKAFLESMTPTERKEFINNLKK